MASLRSAALLGSHADGPRRGPQTALASMIARGDPLPVDLKDRAIYYVGPVAARAERGLSGRPARQPLRAWMGSPRRCWRQRACL